MTTIEKSVEDVQAQIDILKLAMEKDGFKPVVNGRNLPEHLYYHRLGAIEYLKWVIRTKEDEAREEAELEAKLSAMRL